MRRGKCLSSEIEKKKKKQKKKTKQNKTSGTRVLYTRVPLCKKKKKWQKTV